MSYDYKRIIFFLSLQKYIGDYWQKIKLSFPYYNIENIGAWDPNLFEGDMLLTAEQRAAAEAGQDVDAPVSRGSINRGLWREGVLVYRIDSSLSKSNLHHISTNFHFSYLAGTPQHNVAGTHLYTWVERGTLRVKSLAQEHNIMTPVRPRTRTARSGIRRTNHYFFQKLLHLCMHPFSEHPVFAILLHLKFLHFGGFDI